MYKSFTVRNFRCFRDLALTSLERVNLIAGMNNVGKTALLEALFLHCGAYNPELALRLNAFRGLEKVKVEFGGWVESPWNSLFHQFNISNTITLAGEDTVTGRRSLQLSELRKAAELARIPHDAQKALGLEEFTMVPHTFETAKVLELQYRQNKHQSKHYLILDSRGIRTEPIPPAPPFPAYFLGARMRTTFKEEAENFGKLAITKKENIVLEALQLIEPRLQRLALVFMADEPVLHGDIGMDRLIPLPVMGEGIARLASLVIRIGNAAHGVVLIDEIENGLHHTILPKVWQVIGKAARQFDVQVFATTHSLECIKAAHKAFSESNQYDFRLYRLERVKESIRVRAYDRETLEAAIETGLEVR